MDPKPFLSFENQIAKLKSKKLILDSDGIQGVLSRVNYYRLSGYMDSYLTCKGTEKECFIPGTKFSTIYNEYIFDRKLSDILYTILSNVELCLRTYIAYTLGLNYGSLAHYSYKNFQDFQKYQSVFDKLQNEHSNQKNRAFVKNHIENKKGQFPIFVDVELLSFSTLSELIRAMHDKDLKQLDDMFTHVHISSLKTWVSALSSLRNDIAHFHRLFDQRYSSIPVNSKFGRQVDNNLLFAQILSIKELTNENENWIEFKTKFIELIKEYEDKILLKKIGLPQNWEFMLNHPFKPRKPNP